VVDYVKSLGITSVKLLPIHAFLNDNHLLEMGLTNYWGYNTIGFFAADPRYFATGTIAEFKQMIAHLHDVGLEVILDVFYNTPQKATNEVPRFRSEESTMPHITVFFQIIAAFISTTLERVIPSI
jgi:isoamylase